MTVEKLAAILGKELDTWTRVEEGEVLFHFNGLEFNAMLLDAGIVRIFSVIDDEDIPETVRDEDILRMLNGIEKDVPCSKCVLLNRDENGVRYRLCIEFRYDEKAPELNVRGYCEIMMKMMMKFALGLYRLAS